MSKVFFSNNLSVGIIAGGKSRRFGSPKQEAIYDELSLLKHAHSYAEKISDQVLVIIAENQNRQGISENIFTDIIPEKGPIGGVYSALHYASRDFVAIAPCDMPLLSVSIYKHLGTYFNGLQPVVAKSHTGLEPLVSIWPANAETVLKEKIENDELGLYKAIMHLEGKIIDLPKTMPDYRKDWFLNINYPQDLEKITVKILD